MKRLFIFILFLSLIAFGLWRVTESRQEAKTEALRDKPTTIPPRVVNTQGVSTVQFTEADSQATGLVIESIHDSNIPDTALVWFDGKPWVYVEVEPMHFRKMEVSIISFKDDHYEIQSLPAQTRIVTSGAQVLISEEQRGSAEEGQ